MNANDAEEKNVEPVAEDQLMEALKKLDGKKMLTEFLREEQKKADANRAPMNTLADYDAKIARLESKAKARQMHADALRTEMEEKIAAGLL